MAGSKTGSMPDAEKASNKYMKMFENTWEAVQKA